MAFKQPTFAPNARLNAPPAPEANAAPTFASFREAPEQSQEWVLFPSTQSNPQTETTLTEHTPRTAGLSRLSDFGSLNQATTSAHIEGLPCETSLCSVDEDELDGLDDGLPAFQQTPFHQQSGFFGASGSILPRHDGLGTFPASSAPVQEQLWHFEQYNPRKRSSIGHHRRRSSVQQRLDAVGANDNATVEAEKTQRIERWRMEQSRLLLDKIEIETRRRRRSDFSSHREQASSTTGLELIIKASADGYTGEGDGVMAGSDIPTILNDESFLQRLTRRVIRDFIGIDDSMLAVIFGESLPSDSITESASRPSTSQSPTTVDTLNAPSNHGWEKRLLDRIACELGNLMHHFSDHADAFSTPSLLQPSTSEYAGMPITQPTSSRTQPQRMQVPASPSFDFRPTLPETYLHSHASTTAAADNHHASLWGIEEEEAAAAAPPKTHQGQFSEKDYWEQPADLKTVFHYLQDRFTSIQHPTTTSTTTSTSTSKPPPSHPRPPPKHNIAITSTPESLRRAAVIRQHHPLVSRAAATWESRQNGKRRSWLYGYGRPGSSCASASLASGRRRSRTGTSLGSGSRNFWDIGGSGAGSTGYGGGLGAWGEV